jgi:hypothetical protein
MYWDVENDTGELIPFDFNTVIYEETYLYAHWEVNVITITYEHTIDFDEDASEGSVK